MHVFLTGSTGLIGRTLVLRLLRDGHRLTAWVRSAAKARAVLGGEVELIEAATPNAAVLRVMCEADAVIHLAGAGVFDGRWTRNRKRELVDSRVGLTRLLVDGLRESGKRPSVFISASGVGYYGDAPIGAVDERSPAGNDFLAELCVGWEREALKAESLGVRVALIRTGVVLDPGGGALAKLMLPIRAGIGGKLGSGHQPMPWIHMADTVEIYARALTDSHMSGPYNAVAPHPVSNENFTRALGKLLARPTFIPVPGFALRALLGQSASVVLGGQNAVPRRLLAEGFSFAYPRLGVALDELMHRSNAALRRIHKAHPLPESSYLRKRGADYLLTQRTVINAPLSEVFPFFSDATNLGAITPPQMSFRITEQPDRLGEGAEIHYALRLGVVPLTWRTRIEQWAPGERFVDAQLEGPYRSWWHEHTFVADPTNPGRTIMTDRVYYRVPLGVLGRLVHPLLVAPRLREIFHYRDRAIAYRFNIDGRSRTAVAVIPEQRASISAA